jgi:hypothetical protein
MRGKHRKHHRSTRWLSGCLIGAAVVAVAAVVGALIAFSGTEHAPALTGSDHDRIAAELEKVKHDVEQINADARSGVTRPFELAVTDEELSLLLTEDAKVRDSLASRNVEEAWVRVANGHIEATVIRSMGGMSAQIKATMLPVLDGERRVRAKITDIRIGRLPVPQAAAQRLADDIGRLITSKVTDSNVKLTRVSIDGNAIRLLGTTR